MSGDKGFGARTTADEVAQGYDLHGRIAIVTGGASGIGIETARSLLRRGAEVIVAARSLPRAREALAEELKNSEFNLKLMELDLESFRSVRKFAKAFKSEYHSLNYLINNAGVMAMPLSRTPAGLEMQLTVNYLSLFLLTMELLPVLQATENGPTRIINLSSIAHGLAGINFDDINSEKNYNKWAAYGQSKSAVVLFTGELQRRLDAANTNNRVHCFSLHPGGIRTNLQRHMTNDDLRAFNWIDEEGNYSLNFKSTEQGASTTLFATLSEDIISQRGSYLEDCHVVDYPFSRENRNGLAPHAADPETARSLWTVTEELVGQEFTV